jgi:hypothetical protein
MATTTNFGWTTPNDTDLVKDGAAAIRTLGSSIDTTLVDLKGGTTDQVLAKNSNTDMDFKWVTDATGMTNPMTTTGDTIYSSSGSTPARLGIGSTGQVLTVAGGIPSWANASAGATAWTLVNAGGTALTGATDVTISFSAQKELLVLIQNASTANASPEIAIRPNNISTESYTVFGTYDVFPTTWAIGNFDGYQAYSTETKILLGANSAAGNGVTGYCYIDKADQTGWKRFQSVGTGDGNTANWHRYNLSGVVEMSASITSITINSNSGNFDAGTVYILGAN